MSATCATSFQLKMAAAESREDSLSIDLRRIPGGSDGEPDNLITLEVDETEPLGAGALSTVYTGKWGSRSVAVKRLAFREDGAYFREVEILSKLSHENIMKFFDAKKNPDGTLDIVLELACGITLARALHRRRNLTTSWKRSTIYQIANGLAYLHSRGIIHLDLKPPNILFRDRNRQQVLIADFGMARLATRSRRAGARKFRAPDFPFTQKSDVFSLASIACCILSERNPASPEETKEIVARVRTEMHWYPNWHTALIRGLAPNANNRITAEEFRDTFEQPPYSLDIADQSGRTISTVRRPFVFVAIAVVVFLSLITFFLWLFSAKKTH